MKSCNRLEHLGTPDLDQLLVFWFKYCISSSDFSTMSMTMSSACPHRTQISTDRWSCRDAEPCQAQLRHGQTFECAHWCIDTASWQTRTPSLRKTGSYGGLPHKSGIIRRGLESISASVQDGLNVALGFAAESLSSMTLRQRPAQVCSLHGSPCNRYGRSRGTSGSSCLAKELVVLRSCSSDSAWETKVGTQVPWARGGASPLQASFGSPSGLLCIQNSNEEGETDALPRLESASWDTCPGVPSLLS